MRFRNPNAIIVSAIMLVMAANAQCATFTRDSPAASFTAYQNHRVTFATWAGDLSGNDRGQYAEWFTDGRPEGTTPMSGQTDYVSWPKVFAAQGIYQVSACAVYTDPRLVGGSEFRTGMISWTIHVNSCDPTAARVSPDYNVTVDVGSTEIFRWEARDPGGNLMRVEWFYDGDQISIATLVSAGKLHALALKSDGGVIYLSLQTANDLD